MKYGQNVIENLNKDIEHFPNVHPITGEMHKTHDGVSRLVMIDRYAFKDLEKVTLKPGDLTVLTVKEDPKFPARGLGYVQEINYETEMVTVKVEEEFISMLPEEKKESGLVTKRINQIEKPLEIFYEQIAMRNATALSSTEKTPERRQKAFNEFCEILSDTSFIPAGRVLYGAGSESEVTFFNCYVMPFIQDSREGISNHRKEIMEIMSRGGGVGTNGSTLRPRNTLAKGVNGKSSGSVSWLDDIAKLTHLVEQGGSRRGAQMIMMADWHPDIVEFIISKMQNPRILRYLLEQIEDEQIKEIINDKLKFTPLSPKDISMYTSIANYAQKDGYGGFDKTVIQEARQKLKDGGNYTINNSDFLTGANISVCLTDEFMKAVEEDEEYALRFPDIEAYTKEEMAEYNEKWHIVGDVREWERKGYGIKKYRNIRAKDLWNLINISATYSAEPGIFFMDNANDKTNAKAYGQKVVATNPCGEQPLAPYSVCNLAAINLAEVADKKNRTVQWDKLKRIVRIGIRMQDNVIDATPYFLEANKKQALGERRIGLGVMALHDLLIYCGVRYGSKQGNELVDKVFETIATTAYRTSVELAKEKGSFPFLVGRTKEETIKLRERFVNTGYMKNMPDDIRESILEHGIRNSHLLTVAPTGSTGTMAGVSTGLEPYFSFSYFRSGRLGKFIEVKAKILEEAIELYGLDANNLPDYFVAAMELLPEEHADTQCVIQRWVDSSISKTVNAPKGYTVEQVESIYERLYRGGAKGGTVYVDGSRDTQVLTLEAEDNTFEDNEIVELQGEKQKVYLIEELAELTSTNVTIGSEVGDTCPVCREGEVKKIGGCNSCESCGAQLKCGL